MSSTKIAVNLGVASVLAVGLLTAQPPAGKGAGKAKSFAPPAPPKEVTIKAIPGVIGNVKWTKAWEGPATADGMAGSPDGGLLFAQEQTNMIGKIDKNDKFSVFAVAYGAGAVGLAKNGDVYAVERSCTDPGLKMGECPDATSISQITPEHKVIADKMPDGSGLGRINDLTVATTGHIYFTSATPAGGLFHVTPAGVVTAVGMGLRTNGVTLSPDEKTLYTTNGGAVAAFDLAADGTPSNQHEFAKLPMGAQGDGIMVDGEGRLYVSGVAGEFGIHVFDKTGKFLGTIPTPRTPITAAFSGPDKKTLYVGTMGVTMGNGKEYIVPSTVRNVAMTIYKVPMIAAGFKGRAK